MKTISIERADLSTCVTKAQGERIVLTREGRPVALLVGIEGLDEEQLALGTSSTFWKLMRERRKEKTMPRAALEKKIAQRRKARSAVKRPKNWK